MNHASLGGRLQRETFGVDRAQAVHRFEANDLVKEISQTCEPQRHRKAELDLE
jgi:hypothetical protein